MRSKRERRGRREGPQFSPEDAHTDTDMGSLNTSVSKNYTRLWHGETDTEGLRVLTRTVSLFIDFAVRLVPTTPGCNCKVKSSRLELYYTAFTLQVLFFTLSQFDTRLKHSGHIRKTYRYCRSCLTTAGSPHTSYLKFLCECTFSL